MDIKVTTSFFIDYDKLAAMKKRLPRKGERSFVINKLIDLFLQNKVKIETVNKQY